jgi:hypothetical protein
LTWNAAYNIKLLDSTIDRRKKVINITLNVESDTLIGPMCFTNVTLIMGPMEYLFRRMFKYPRIIIKIMTELFSNFIRFPNLFPYLTGLGRVACTYSTLILH